MEATRAIKIKCGVIKRLHKDWKSYEEQGRQELVGVERMEQRGADFHDVKKAREVLQETLNMVPDCKRRLDKARAELEELLAAQGQLVGTPDYAAALEALEQTSE